MRRAVLLRNLAICALGATLCLAGMLATSLLYGGITQQHFEQVRPAADYAALLRASETPLRIILSLDNLFVLFYAAAFLFLGTSLRGKQTRYGVVGATIALMMAAGLDLAENHHIQVMLDSARLGIAPTQEQIATRAEWSMLKFHSAYLGLFVFSFLLPEDTLTERLLRFGIRFALIPAGILVYTVRGDATIVLVLIRYLSMLVGFGLLAYNYFVRARGRHIVYE